MLGTGRGQSALFSMRSTHILARAGESQTDFIASSLRTEAIKALRGARSSTGIEADFARLLGLDDMTRIHQEDGTRDKLVLAFGALDGDGDKKLSFEEFRRVVAGAAVTPDPTLALGP